MAATITLPRPIAAESGVRARLRLWPEWLTLSLYSCVVAYAIPFHEPWADEAQAWQMARALSVHDLLFHSLRYEGTPALWHLLLRGLILLHVSYAQMHWISGLIAICGMSLLIFFAPFPRWVRLTLPFTVFFAFQWAVVARSYVLVPLLTFAAAILWRKSSFAVAALLGVLANTSLHALGLASGLALIYVIETRRGEHPKKRAVVALMVFLVLCGVALLTAFPPPSDLAFAPELVHESIPDHLLGVLPLAGLYLLRAASYSWILSAVLAPAVIWIIYRTVGAAYLFPVVFVALISGIVYWNYWHVGFASVAVIATAWIVWRPYGPKFQLLGSGVFICWLIIQLSYAAFALAWDHRFPYSPDAAASQYLRRVVDNKLPLAVTLVNTNDAGEFHSVGLAPYFDEPLFLNQPRQYWLWSKREHTDAQFRAALDKDPVAVVAMYRSHRGRLFDRSYDLDSRHLQPLYDRGYGVTQVFCGARPEALSFHEQICEIVLER